MNDSNPNCLLGYYPEKCDKCTPGECPTCGWNPEIDKQRRAKLREEYK